MIRNLKQKSNNIINITSVNEKDPRLVDPGTNLSESFYFDSLVPDDIKKFIKHVEDKVRKSNMYSAYLSTLIDSGLDHCAIKGNITRDDATLEFHHYPFTLYDITYTILKKKMDNNEKITSFSMITAVMEEHAKNHVGLVSLSTTNHQLYHDGELSLDLDMVYGNVQGFIEEYRDYLSSEMENRFNMLVEITNNKRNKEK